MSVSVDFIFMGRTPYLCLFHINAKNEEDEKTDNKNNGDSKHNDLGDTRQLIGM